MPTVAARRLTEAHRLAQVRLGAQTIVALGSVFRLLDPTDLDRTFPDWLHAAAPLVDVQRETSSHLAANYLQALKQLELSADLKPVLAGPAPAEAVATSLLVTGPISLKKAAARGVLLAKALPTAQAASSAAAMRHVLNGGRETITHTIRRDPDASGWRRVTSGRACAFCSMLAGRGAVYSADTVDFQCHDGCSCNAEPVWN